MHKVQKNKNLTPTQYYWFTERALTEKSHLLTILLSFRGFKITHF
ncbi:hypothetical protein UYSO10_3491 [Kosakonia radicincitans]|nr:hypothetical protein UYSO10_3491 [Kosakonia radicincitans]